MSTYRGIYKKDVEIAKILAHIVSRRNPKDFNTWHNHYENDLNHMYESMKKDFLNLNISYEAFVRIAYNCTSERYNNNNHKYYRPLI